MHPALLSLTAAWSMTPKPSYDLEFIAFPSEWKYAYADSMDRSGTRVVVANRTVTGPGTRTFALTTKGKSVVLDLPAEFVAADVSGVLKDGTVFGTGYRAIDSVEKVLFQPFVIGPSKWLRASLAQVAWEWSVELVGATEGGNLVVNHYYDLRYSSPMQPVARSVAITDGKKIERHNQRAFVMNDNGAFVCTDPTWEQQLCISDRGETKYLYPGSLRGLQPSFTPTGLNNRLTVIGSDPGDPSSFIVFENGVQIRVKGRPDQFMSATAVNNKGDVVGMYTNGGGSGISPPPPDGFLWTNHKLYSLGSLAKLPDGSQIEWVHQINDDGNILVTVVKPGASQTVPAMLRRRRP